MRTFAGVLDVFLPESTSTKGAAVVIFRAEIESVDDRAIALGAIAGVFAMNPIHKYPYCMDRHRSQYPKYTTVTWVDIVGRV